MDRPTSLQATSSPVNANVNEVAPHDDFDARFDALFDRDYPYVWHSLRRLGVHEGDCDDVANEVFVRVHEHFADYDPTRPSRPWLFAFCARLSSDYRRLARHRREEALEEGHVIASTNDHPEAQMLRRERDSLVMRALDALDDERRQVFVLHAVEERPVPEVADILAIPVPTAYTRLRAARQTFTEAVRRLQARSTP